MAQKYACNEVAVYKNDLKNVERFGGTPEEIANIRSNIEAYAESKITYEICTDYPYFHHRHGFWL